MDRIAAVRELVKKELDKSGSPGQFSLHIVPVRDYAVKLADIAKADREVVELAAWLHDLTRITIGSKDHHKTGAEEAGKILRGLGYPEKTISHVRDCILTHRSMERDGPPQTIEAKIIASADAMAHYDTIPMLVVYKFGKTGSLKEAIEWVLEKVNRGWENKILLPEARGMVKDKYEAARLLLETNLKYLD
jgi:predicted metal-dependent HD superfamily phosphohydrolase